MSTTLLYYERLILTLYIVRRLIQALTVFILTMTLVFFILRLLPGDPILIYMTQSQYARSSTEEIEAVRHKFKLDEPVYVQYFKWFSGLFHGNLGQSAIKRAPVSESIFSALSISLYLALLTFVFSNIIAIPMGIICAIRRGKLLDTLLTVLANIGITAPIFWVGVLLIYIFSVWLHWLPTHGYTSPVDGFWASTRTIILPVFCLILFPLASTVRQTRSALLEVLHQDYIRTARSKGLREHVIILKHSLKNGMLPVLTLAGINWTFIIGGEVLVETIFAIPGLGKLAVDGLLDRDYMIVQGVILIVAIIILLSNLIVDIIYGWLDPRIRIQ